MSEREREDGRRSSQARDACIIMILVAAVLFYFRSLLWTRELVYGGLDITRQFYVFKKTSYAALSSGEWPLWMPFIYCGMPLLGSLIETPFHPLDLLFAFLPIPLNMVFNWTLIVHLIVAELFSYLLFKRMFQSRAVAAFCSLWIWSPFVLNSIETGDANNIRAILMVPPILYFAEEAFSSHDKFSKFMACGITLAIQVLCGGLQYVFYTLVFVAGYSSFLILRAAIAGEPLKERVAGLVGVVLIGLTLPAVQLFPALEYARLSVRSADLPWFTAWAIEPRQLVDYVVPFYAGGELSFGYFGILPLVLAVSSLHFWRDSRKYFFLAAAAIALINGLGTNTWLSYKLVSLPIMRSFRGPFRATLFFNLSCMILAGGALRGLLNEARRRESKSHRLWLLVLTILMLGSFLMLWYKPINRFHLGVSFGLALVSCIIVWSAFLYPRRAKAITIAAVILLAADLGFRFHGYYESSPTSLFEKDWTVKRLEQEDFGHRVLVHGTPHSNYFALFGIESANGHHAFPPLRTAQFLSLLSDPRLASLSGVKYKLFYSRDEDGQLSHPPTRGRDSVKIESAAYEPMGRTTMMNLYRVRKPEAVLKVLTRPDFDPRREVVLEKSPVPWFEPDGVGHEPGRAFAEERSFNRLKVRTESGSDSLLLVSESNYPGWTAKIDGVGAELYTADYLFRAVFVPAGSHTVEFRFRPVSFTAGSIVSAVSLLAAVVTLVVLKRRKCAPQGWARRSG
ncbi:MAG: YfhO family protein [Candidatus Hydrogenedentota bacterium]|nr:MAG: YfhO family protein [Candidatus Hydrogenedentota bacterium]